MRRGTKLAGAGVGMLLTLSVYIRFHAKAKSLVPQVATHNELDLTVFSLWRDNFEFYLPAHIQFYARFWKADRLWINVGRTCDTDLTFVNNCLAKMCGPVIVTESLDLGLMGLGTLTIRACSDKVLQRVYVLAYSADDPSPQTWQQHKIKLFEVFDTYRQKTGFGEASLLVRQILVDHDEFFVPAFGDTLSALNQDAFNYHIREFSLCAVSVSLDEHSISRGWCVVDINPTPASRDWSKSLQWVDQPYFYKMRCANTKLPYPDDSYDGNLPMGSLWRQNHIGPWPEHASLRACAQRGSGAHYVSCLRAHNVMYHISVPSEEYFLTKKFFDQSRPGSAAWNPDVTNKRNNFHKCFLNPERDFLVFDDEFLRPYLTPPTELTLSMDWDDDGMTMYTAQKQTLRGGVAHTVRTLSSGPVTFNSASLAKIPFWCLHFRKFSGTSLICVLVYPTSIK
jgi:hypothetical protein